jgi:hypothetical protein
MWTTWWSARNNEGGWYYEMERDSWEQGMAEDVETGGCGHTASAIEIGRHICRVVLR